MDDGKYTEVDPDPFASMRNHQTLADELTDAVPMVDRDKIVPCGDLDELAVLYRSSRLYGDRDVVIRIRAKRLDPMDAAGKADYAVQVSLFGPESEMHLPGFYCDFLDEVPDEIERRLDDAHRAIWGEAAQQSFFDLEDTDE